MAGGRASLSSKDSRVRGVDDGLNRLKPAVTLETDLPDPQRTWRDDLQWLGDQARWGLFFAWCLSSSAFYILTSTPLEILTVDDTGKALYVLEEMVRLLIPPLTLHFFLTFPRDLATHPAVRRMVPAVYMPSAFLALLQTDLIFANGRFLLGAPSIDTLAALVRRLDRIELYLFVAFAIGAAGLLLYRLTAPGRHEQKRQLLWIALGMACGTLPFLLLYLVPFSLGLTAPTALELVVVLPLGLVPLTFAYAILRYRLWDISVIARDVATYTLTLLFGLLGFTFLQMLVLRGVPESAGLTRNLLSVAAVLVVGGLLAPARQGISSTLERVQYRQSYGKRRTLTRLGRELLHDRDLESLASKLLDHLEEALRLERTNLLLSEQDQLTPLRREEIEVGHLLADFLPDDFWSSDYQRLSGVALPDAIASPAQRLYMQGYRYAFPLTVRGRRVGVVLCSHRYGDLPLSSNDLELIRQFLNQASLAIENAHLLDSLQNQLEEVRQLKQFSESIIEASPAGIAVLDSDDRVVSANVAFASLAGATGGSIRGSHLLDVLPLAEVPEPKDGVVELTLPDAGGGERSLQISVASFSPSTTSDMTVLVVNDVTERVAMERALKEKDRLAALGVMAAGIAHEVNTPITGISSYAQMLLQATEDEDPRYETLKKVERQTFRASRIVNSLLSLARNQDLDPQPVRLVELIRECAELLRDQAARNQVTIALDLPSEEKIVSGSDGQLQQVFTNLFQNAREAMKDDGGTIAVALRTRGRWIETTVTDSGPGIAREARGRIFEPFYSTKQKTGGTGLGLSISHEIVRRHGGELRLAPAGEGGGTCFLVRLREAETKA